MAKQIGDHFITGTFDNLTFYKMDGQYYVRTKSSLTAKRVKKSKAFAATMKSAEELSIASTLASQVYRSIDKNTRHISLYRKLTGIAKLLVKKNADKEEIKKQLEHYVANILNTCAKEAGVNKKLKPSVNVCNRPQAFKNYLTASHKLWDRRLRKGTEKKTGIENCCLCYGPMQLPMTL